jgi:AmmeMemoRadiSam system protein A
MSVADGVDRAALLKLARAALGAHLAGNPPPEFHAVEGATRPAGAFVTLRKHDQLRGCIGSLGTSEPLGAVITRCVVAAASSDPRFPPVAREELSSIQIELSILGPLDPVETIDEVVVGRHGLVVEQGWSRGLLLPQVATEWGWDRETFASHACVKAGLPPDAWRRGGALFRFEADVFGEE